MSKVNDEWFADEEKVRRVVGLLEYPVAVPDAKEVINSSLELCSVLSQCIFCRMPN